MPQIGVSVSQEIIDELDAEAKRVDRSRSQVAAMRIERAGDAANLAMYAQDALKMLDFLAGQGHDFEDNNNGLRSALAAFEKATG